MQQLRAMMRARSQYAASQSEKASTAPPPLVTGGASRPRSLSSDPVYNFSRQILKGSEHTWGIHVQVRAVEMGCLFAGCI